uniref:HSF-type DNA-binding domain-containing protein n=1 Tax=Gouania willdenowi TaxID=441366 RepID=A0A8C5DIB5_GOUWI
QLHTQGGGARGRGTEDGFTSKLWSLVNDPANDSIFWDSRGEDVIINQCLFEKEVLSQGCGLPDTFKSFHRQLNLYRFKKVQDSGVKMGCRHFYNPNFKRGYPELTFLAGGKGCASPVPLKNTMSVDHSAALLILTVHICSVIDVQRSFFLIVKQNNECSNLFSTN